MSVSQHPIALRLEERVGGAIRLLATVMALPLIDGIFPALVLAGALSTFVGIVETGLLIFGGSATMAVILAEMDGPRRKQVRSVLVIGALIVPIAALQAAIAPTIAGLLDLAIFQRFAGLVILTVAAKTASSKVADVLPNPSVIIALGLVASVSPSGAELAFSSDPEIVARGAAAAAVGVAFALAVALSAPQLRGHVDIDRFRFGSAVALGVLALPILGLLETDAPIALAVLVVTGLFAYDPNADPDAITIGRHGGPTDHGPDDAPRAPDVTDPLEAPEALHQVPTGRAPSAWLPADRNGGSIPSAIADGSLSEAVLGGDPADTDRAPAAFGAPSDEAAEPSEKTVNPEEDAADHPRAEEDRDADDATRAPWL
ncbi:DUF5794 domain-containing protein [Halopenitus sp. H-Gu1]|uniref:DUF5794 domain-containing protein n=1 Tax=Halopenitus sp. H-Gu1 TaxID=3242697 RepID=UPI00359CC422